MHLVYDHGAWGNWENLGGAWRFLVGAASPEVGKIEVLVTDGAPQLFTRSYQGGTWIAPDPLSERDEVNGLGQVVRTGNQRLDLVMRGQHSEVKHLAYIGVNWGRNWETLGGPASDPPGIAGWTDPGHGLPHLETFISGTNHAIYRKRSDGGVWTATWEDIGTTPYTWVFDPQGVSWAPGRIDLIGYGSDTNKVYLAHRFFQ